MKTKYEKELEKETQFQLVYMCEARRLLHTGNKDQLIARLVEAEQAEAKQETESGPIEG